MTAFVELGQSLHNMGFMQLVLVLAFLASYSLTLTGLPAARAERFAIAGAWFSAAGFAAFTDPWVHGVMLIVFTIGAMGLFIAGVWVINTLFGLAPNRAGAHSLRADAARAVATHEVAPTLY